MTTSSVTTAERNVRRGAACLLLAILIGAAGCSETQSQLKAAEDEGAEKRPLNRLGQSNSPYLLAHARNPVDWQPWGPDALAQAKREGKLIFLSVGYSTCHWCHVMEKKVFSDPKIAKLLNDHFVCIKVDREERPDVDEVYMLALQVYLKAIGSDQPGGWPLSMFLTPDARPLGGGTYFPPEDEEDRDGFPTVVRRVLDAWTDSRDDMLKNADLLTRAVQGAARPRIVFNPIQLDRELLSGATKGLVETFDAEHGGFDFSRAQPNKPKFPLPVRLALLQYEVRRHGHARAAEMLALTLDRLAAGGIHDQVGGGFHRYSTDRYWRIPHFEKMLYDNAQLADVYLEAYRQTQDARYRDVADDTLTFILRELSDPAGGFYAALDADTDGVEGRYYVWSREEIEKTLSREELAPCTALYGLDEEPNFEGAYVLEQRRTPADVRAALKLSLAEFQTLLADAHEKLQTVRRQRTPLRKDDKVLSGWNGLTIRALAHAGKLLDRPEYTQAAERAAGFVLTQMRNADGRLLRSYRAGEAAGTAYLDDYAFLVEGLLALYDTTDDEKWLNAAARLTDLEIELFWDERQKGFYYTPHDHEELLVRTKLWQDSVLPAGSSVTIRNLIRLASYTARPEYRTRAEETLQSQVILFQGSARSMANYALAGGEFLDDPNFAAGRQPVGGRPVKPPVPEEQEEPQGAARLEDVADSPIQLVADEQPAKPKKKLPEHVKGQVFLSTDKLPAGGTCQFFLLLTIEEGWHINSNPAADDFTIATEVTVTSQLETSASQVRYPKGKTFKIEGIEDPLLVYDGQTAIRGQLQAPTAAGGQTEELTFEIQYQACSEKTCLRPQTLTIVVPVEVAKPGTPVRPAHEKYFPPKKPK